MRAILHIGLQKTGTSSIQLMLAGSEHYLNEVGFTYPLLPDTGGSVSRVWNSPFRHNIIAGTYADFRSVFETLTEEDAVQFWKDILAKGISPILSAEEFSRQRDFSYIAEAMEGFEIDVVVYLRRQDRYMESLYNQRNKILAQREDPTFIDESFLTETDVMHFNKVSGYLRMMNYVDLLDRVKSQLKPRQIIVRCFDREQMVGGDVCMDFCEAVGFDIEKMVRPSREANQSIKNETLLAWKQIYLEDGEEEAIQFIRGINQAMRDGDDFSGDYKILSNRTRTHVLRDFNDVNVALRQTYNVDLFN